MEEKKPSYLINLIYEDLAREYCERFIIQYYLRGNNVFNKTLF
jgi:hypothetical protein